MAETEKITINMSIVDLGKVDLLVEEGFYSNRTDFIRTAIRNQLNQHESAVDQVIKRHSYSMGIVILTAEGMERKRAAGEKSSYTVLGMLQIQNDVTPELADQVIDKIVVRGVLRAPEAVKQVLADRIS